MKKRIWGGVIVKLKILAVKWNLYVNIVNKIVYKRTLFYLYLNNKRIKLNFVWADDDNK